MATLDEKFLDGPNVGYCSDSDEEEAATSAPPPADYPGASRSQRAPQHSKAGAKGVLADYRAHQHARLDAQRDNEARVRCLKVIQWPCKRFKFLRWCIKRSVSRSLAMPS